jgi:hypothetical protein
MPRKNDKFRLLDISGVCSACGDTLLAKLSSDEKPVRELLEERLQSRFTAHLIQKHAAEMLEQ